MKKAGLDSNRVETAVEEEVDKLIQNPKITVYKANRQLTNATKLQIRQRLGSIAREKAQKI